MATKLKIKKKDRVIVIAGKDKGKIGEVTAVLPKENRVIVSGVNMIARHTKPSQGIRRAASSAGSADPCVERRAYRPER